MTTFVPKTEPLPDVPARYIKCFSEDNRFDLPPGPWTKEQVQAVVADLQKSEFDIGKCGRDFVDFYINLQEGLSTND